VSREHNLCHVTYAFFFVRHSYGPMTGIALVSSTATSTTNRLVGEWLAAAWVRVATNK